MVAKCDLGCYLGERLSLDLASADAREYYRASRQAICQRPPWSNAVR